MQTLFTAIYFNHVIKYGGILSVSHFVQLTKQGYKKSSLLREEQIENTQQTQLKNFIHFGSLIHYMFLGYFKYDHQFEKFISLHFIQSIY